MKEANKMNNNKESGRQSSGIWFWSSVRNRLATGFSIVILIFVVAVAINIVQNYRTKYFAEQVRQIKIPTTEALTSFLGQTRAILSNLRGFMLTNDMNYLSESKQEWTNLHIVNKKINELSENWNDPSAAVIWREVNELIPVLENAQSEVLKATTASDKQLALKLLQEKAVPTFNALMDRLAGKRDANYFRSGGLVFYFTEKLKQDEEKLVAEMSGVIYIQWSMLIMGIIFSLGAVIITTRSITHPIFKANKHISNVASGDLTQRLVINDNSELGDLSNNLNHMTDSLSTITKQINEASHHMVTSLNEVNNAVTSQSSGASEQASAINEITTTLEELETSSTQNLDKVSELGKVAQKTDAESMAGLEVVQQTIDGMGEIRDKVKAIANTILELSNFTQQIGEITAAVSDLAKQSKMLSLNASIEAAKAGEAGRGFSVVAQEVRNLAEQSEQATRQVQKILEDISRATEKAVMATEEGNKGVDNGMKLAEKTGTAMKSLRGVIHDTTMACQHIVAAVRQESVGIKQITSSMDDINQVTTSFVTGVKQTTGAIDNLVDIAKQLKTHIDIYRIQ